MSPPRPLTSQRGSWQLTTAEGGVVTLLLRCEHWKVFMSRVGPHISPDMKSTIWAQKQKVKWKDGISLGGRMGADTSGGFEGKFC